VLPQTLLAVARGKGSNKERIPKGSREERMGRQKREGEAVYLQKFSTRSLAIAKETVRLLHNIEIRILH